MDDGAMDEPELLSGGNASGAVVRIGTTVRKPWSPTTPRVQDFVAALRERGIDLPRPLGRDEQGRAVSEYVPGVLAMDMGELDAELLRRVGSLVRSIHEASRGLAVPQDWPVLLPAPDAADLLCHNDLAPWNLVIDGERLVFIDADGAGPSTRLWDLAYAAVAFCRVFAGEDPEGVASRLGAFLDGYGREDAELMAALPDALGERCAAMHRMLVQARAEGTQPWASMHDDGHGAHGRAPQPSPGGIGRCGSGCAHGQVCAVPLRSSASAVPHGSSPTCARPVATWRWRVASCWPPRSSTRAQLVSRRRFWMSCTCARSTWLTGCSW